MKKVLILATAIVMCASFAWAQGGHIGIYSDADTYQDCHLNYDAGALYSNLTVYIVHSGAPEGNTSQFAVNTGGLAGFANPGAADFQSNLTLGDVNTGIVVTYVGCKALPHLLATWPLFVFGVAPECTAGMQVVPDPSVGRVEAVDCSSTKWEATGGELILNGNETCPCVEPIATKESNWSKIKALYQ